MNPSFFEILSIFGLSVVIALVMTPVSIRVAHKIGAMDVPKDWRRMHDHAIPRFGGLAIFAAVMITMGVFAWDEPGIRVAMLGGALMYLLGVIDDLKDLPAIAKLIGQIAIAVLMFSMDMRVSFISNYFGEGRLHFNTVVCFIFTVLWIIGITNTINIIDGLDGLAAGISAIAALCIAYIAYIHGATAGMPIVCIAMVAIAGSCVGFLPFNFSPAKTFMGDGGALFLGFMISILSVIGPLKRSTIIAVVVPVVVLAIPIFDTSFAILRRMVNRKPIMEADKEHLHHRLMAYGYGQRRTVIMLYGISAIMGMSAVLISRELYKDAIVLAFIAGAYLYVFLTDPNRKMPHIKAVNIAEEEKKKHLLNLIGIKKHKNVDEDKK
ncbi:MAG: MraY family glycosyltransferase [Eubacterium sp.]|nr:MraY family glycosyltransferase [Eubacterium sp.]